MRLRGSGHGRSRPARPIDLRVGRSPSGDPPLRITRSVPRCSNDLMAECAVRRRERTHQPAAGIRPPSPERDAGVTAPPLDVRRPAHDSSCLGVKEGLQRTVRLNCCRRRGLIIRTDDCAARVGPTTPTRLRGSPPALRWPGPLSSWRTWLPSEHPSLSACEHVRRDERSRDGDRDGDVAGDPKRDRPSRRHLC